MSAPSVLHLSGSDLAGGAARAAYRLHRALVEGGAVDSRMLVRSRRSLDDRVQRLGHSQRLGDKVTARWTDHRVRRDFARYEETRPRGYDAFTDDRAGIGRHLMRQLPACDVLHLHWVKGLVDYRHFFTNLPESVRLVWTLHDMNPFTGGCHYDHGCGRYLNGCGACPQLGSSAADDLSAQVWRRKRAAFEAIEPDRLHVVAPSRWLAGLAKQSPLLGRFKVHAVANGVDTNAFAPRDRDAARRTLGLPTDAKVLLFVAHGLEGIRKGFDQLREALRRMARIDDLWLLSAGGMHELPEVTIPHLNVGEVTHDRMLSLVYSAADVMVIPSMQDNLPNTVLESLACGTPIIGFDAGGIPEMVEPGITGWLAETADTASLAARLDEALAADEQREVMRKQCRRIAVQRYDRAVQARAYAALYEQVLSDSAEPIGSDVVQTEEVVTLA